MNAAHGAPPPPPGREVPRSRGDRWLQASDVVLACRKAGFTLTSLRSAPARSAPARSAPGLSALVAVCTIVLVAMFVACAAAGVPAEAGQVSDLRARHGAGVTLLSWKEVDPPQIAARISVAELRTLRSRLSDSGANRYRVYRSTRPIATLRGLKPIAELPSLTAWNAEYYGRSFKPEHHASRYVIDSDAGPVPHGTGIYAHHPSRAGKAYYAVTCVRGGREVRQISAANSLSEPVEEGVGPGAPVLQRIETPQEDHYVRGPTIHYYVRWEAPPFSNRPNQPFDYRVAIPPGVVEPAPLGLHLHCWGGHLDRGYIWWYGASDGAIQVASNQEPYDWWIAHHETYDATKRWEWKKGRGVTRDYTVRRLLGFVDWVATQWPIDRQRVFVAGSSMGGSGASMIALRYPERFAFALSSVGVHTAAQSPTFRSSYEAVCGPVDPSNLHESGLETFQYLDNTFLLRQDPARDAPFISFANGKNDKGIGWEQAATYARALQETRQPHVFKWAQSGHGTRVYVPTATGGGDGSPRLKNYLDVRLGRALPAFTRCSLDDDPGGGDPTDGDASGQLNLYLRWEADGVVDQSDRFVVSCYLIGDAPQETCRVDITPRRTQRFRWPPGTRSRWAVVDSAGAEVQSGETHADQWGLVTLSAVELTKSPRRVRVQPAR